MEEARERKFKVLVVRKLERLSRSLKDLINTLDELGSLGIDFVSYNNNLDTSTPTGKLVFQIVGVVADFGKDIIKERMIAGLANAWRKDKGLGRPLLADELYEKAKNLRQQGFSLRKIGREPALTKALRFRSATKIRIRPYECCQVRLVFTFLYSSTTLPM